MLREIYLHFWRGQQKRGTRREEEEEDCGWVSLAPDYYPTSSSEYDSCTHALTANGIVYPLNKNVDQKVLPETDGGRRLSTERREDSKPRTK